MSWLESRWYSKKPAPCWLLPFESLYRFLAKRASTKAKKYSWQAPVPVIVVGNISVGGTGKTPLTVSLISALKERGYKPGIVSRGYKSEAPEYPYLIDSNSTPIEAGDEPYLLFHRCECPVVIAPDRTAAAKLLLEKTDCDLIISDDGLQHYRLDRDLEIVVIDGQRGLGNGHCLPAGPLREKSERLQSVDYVISNGPLLVPLDVANIQSFQMNLKPNLFRQCKDRNTAVGLDHFNGEVVHAVAGIGNPERFFQSLRQECELEVIPHPKKDHQAFEKGDICFADGLSVLMTEKDAVKVKEFADEKHWYLEVSAALPDNFISQLQAKLEAVKELKGNLKNG